MKWKDLTFLQKIQFKNICDRKYGGTQVVSEDGEPIYFDEQLRIINTSIIIELLLNLKLN